MADTPFRIEFSRLYPWQDIRVSTFYSDLRRNTSRDGSSHLLRPQGVSKQRTHCNSLIQDWSQCTRMSKYLLNPYYFFTSDCGLMKLLQWFQIMELKLVNLRCARVCPASGWGHWDSEPARFQLQANVHHSLLWRFFKAANSRLSVC